MDDLKAELKKLITETMLPEAEAYLNELNVELEKNSNDEDIKGAIQDMNSFNEELKFILTNIENNTISEEETQIVYEKIITLLNEHEGEE